MKVLVTGANGYIGRNLIQALAISGYQVVALVRKRESLFVPCHLESLITIVEGDLLDPSSLKKIPIDIVAAYYLVHSMKSQSKGFTSLESECASNFLEAVSHTKAKQLIYLSGLINAKTESEHMLSRKNVESILKEGNIPVTVLRTSVIIGEGSASFEIIRDLVEKLPVMIGPKWICSKCQPIAIKNVLYYLIGVLNKAECSGETFEIGGPEILTYKKVLLNFAKNRGLKRWIITVPFLTPYLSSLWLYLVTSTNFSLARALVNSLTADSICREKKIQKIFPYKCLSLSESIESTFIEIEPTPLAGSWQEAIKKIKENGTEYIQVPAFGVKKLTFLKEKKISSKKIKENLWRIGGKNGWYSCTWIWALRGHIDTLFKGVGARKERSHSKDLFPGDTLDFWKVLLADKESGRLILYGEIKVPGEMWLEWEIKEEKGSTCVVEILSFRPKGILGFLYWYGFYPLHKVIFQILLNALFKQGHLKVLKT